MRASLRDGSAAARAGNVRALTALVAAGLLLGAAAVLVLRTAGEWADPGSAQASAPAVAKVAATPAGAAAPRTPAVAAKPVGRAAGLQPMAHIDDQLTYQYNALGRRDPFQPLINGAYVGADVGGDAPPDVGGIRVVGIVWGASDKFALVEDPRGDSFVLRCGDKVMNGVVTELKRDALVVNLTTDGQSQTVTIPLIRKGDSNANR
jgi:hypothetical protein